MTHKVLEMWAWTYDTPDGDEGIVGAVVGGIAMPLITSKERLAKSDHMRQAATDHAHALGSPARLKRFIFTEVSETVGCSCQTCS